MIAARVTFITHDASFIVFNNVFRTKVPYYHGCIEIGDNVFISSNSIILPDVKVCDNVFIAAVSVVVHDIEEEGVYGGVPVRRLKGFEELYFSRLNNEYCLSDDEDSCWENFWAK